MSHGMPLGPALEQLREVTSILRELGNAGPRDQSFKQWRQVTLTLLQRIWPEDQAKAARFRRIPFSTPSSRADARTVRECYERGVCEAIAYLDSLVEELGRGPGGRPGRKLVRPAEAPVRSEEPAARREPITPQPIAIEPIGVEPIGAGSWTRDQDLGGGIRPERSFAPPDPPAIEPVVPPPAARATPAPPAAQAHEPRSHAPEELGMPAPERAEPGRGAGRSKPRLKDMLGFSDEGAAHAAAPGPHAGPGPSAPPSPAAARPAAPIAPAASAPPAPSAPDLPPPDELSAEEGPWSAPVIPFPSHRAGEGRFPAPSAPVPPAGDAFDEAEDEAAAGPGFDLAAEAGLDVEPPPATLREMLDIGPRRRAAAPSRAAREVLAMAAAVDQLGVPPARRAIVRATLIDLGHQMEAPPVQWTAIRQAMAFMMDYPQIARRVIPMLLPYLDEAA